MSENEKPKDEQKPRSIRGRYCETQRIATNKYLKSNYFNTKLKLSDKERIKEAAAAVNMSMNAFIQDCVYRRLYEILDKPKEEE